MIWWSNLQTSLFPGLEIRCRIKQSRRWVLQRSRLLIKSLLLCEDPSLDLQHCGRTSSWWKKILFTSSVAPTFVISYTKSWVVLCAGFDLEYLWTWAASTHRQLFWVSELLCRSWWLQQLCTNSHIPKVDKRLVLPVPQCWTCFGIVTVEDVAIYSLSLSLSQELQLQMSANGV
jgi:hypothetical protein